VSELGKVDVSALGLEDLATRINAEHRACEAALKSGLAHALAAGRLLTEAKSHTKHGEWGNWLKANFEGSARTAQAYMRVARELPANAQRVTHLSFRGALKELSSAVGEEAEEDAVYAELLDLRERLERADTIQEVVQIARRSEELRRAKAEESVRLLRWGGQYLLELEQLAKEHGILDEVRNSPCPSVPAHELEEMRVLASIPDDLFERKVAELRRKPLYTEALTKGQMLKYARGLKAQAAREARKA
jgi:hypothetical protein